MGLFGSVLSFGVSLGPVASQAQSSPTGHTEPHRASLVHLVSVTPTAHAGSARHVAVTAKVNGAEGGFTRALAKGGKSHVRYAKWGGGGISCVPFARQASGIELKGNAANWWDEADGVYARGNIPEPGSVLNFRANASMRLGHVAVVSSVVSSREIEIDHANWAGPGARSGGISRNMSVIDVSPDNDWTAVRVSLGRSGEYGSIYPTYGFIYDHNTPVPTHPTVTASIVPSSILNPPPRDLRPLSERVPAFTPPSSYDEVAEAPAGRGPDLSLPEQTDAPDRSFR